jgi:MFS family permease
MLIAFRAVQAVGGAMTFSISGAILYAAFPPDERGRAMGFLGSTVAVGSILGPALGGLLVDSLGWPFIFFINVPIGGVLIAASIPLLRGQESRRSAPSRMDWIGAALLAGMLLAFVSTFMMNISGPFYFQGVMGYTPSQVGLVFLVVPAVTVIASPLSGWLFDKRYWKHYGRLGMAVVALCLLALGLAALRIDFRRMIPLFAVLGLGSALFQSPNSTEIMNAFPREKAGVASSITATVRNLGMTVGTSVATLLISAQLAGTGYAGAILQADKPLLARVLGVTIVASGAVAAAASLSL